MEVNRPTSATGKPPGQNPPASQGPVPPNGKAPGTKPPKKEDDLEKTLTQKVFNFIYNPNNLKDTVNTVGNLIGAIPNIFGAINSFTGIIDIDPETSDRWFGNFSKVSTMSRGITGIVDCAKKNNLVPLIGCILEIPVALFSSGYNLWLARGIPQSIRQIQAVIKKREAEVEVNGKKIKLGTQDGDDFKKYGITLGQGFLISMKELGSTFREIVTKPFAKEKRFSRAMLGCSTLQFCGPLLALLNEKVGVFVRDLGGVLVDFAYMAGGKNYLKGGCLWVGSAAFDFEKRLVQDDSLKGAFNHLSQLLDPLAAIFESKGHFEGANENSS